MQRRLTIYLAFCSLVLCALTGCPKKGGNVRDDNRIKKPVQVQRTARGAYQEALMLHRQQKGSSKPNYDPAIKLYKEALSLNPSLVAARFNLASIHEELGEYKRASSLFTQILQNNERHTAAMYRLAQVYIRQKPPRPHNALRLLQRYMTLLPKTKNDPKMLMNVATLQMQSGNYAMALTTARKCLALDSKNIAAYRLIANVNLRQKRYEGVHVVYDLSQKISKRDAKLQNIRGLAFIAQKKYPKAILSFAQAVKLEPSLFAAQMNLGALALRYYDKRRALYALQKAVSLRPSHRDALMMYAVALRANKKLKMAEAVYTKRLLRRNKQDADSIFNLSVLYLKFMNKPRKAKIYLRKYIGIKGSVIDNNHISYQLLKQCEQKIKAEEMMKKMQEQQARQAKQAKKAKKKPAKRRPVNIPKVNIPKTPAGDQAPPAGNKQTNAPKS